MSPECNSQADIVFVVDSSRYNSGSDFRTMKRFLRSLVKQMAFKGDRFRVGVVEYGSSPRNRLALSDGDNKRSVKSVLAKLRFVLIHQILENILLDNTFCFYLIV